MLPLEFVDELPEFMPEPVPEFIELPELVAPVVEPLPIVLPEPVVEPAAEPLVDEPEPVVLPELVVEGLVVDVDDDGVVVVPVVVVVVVVALPDGDVVVLLDGVVLVLLLPEGAVVVDEPELDCAMAAPPTMSNDAVARAVVVFKNEPMVMTPGVVDTKCHRPPRQRQIAMSDVQLRGKACARSATMGRVLVTNCSSRNAPLSACGTPFAPPGLPATSLRGFYGHLFFFVSRVLVDAFLVVDNLSRLHALVERRHAGHVRRH